MVPILTTRVIGDRLEFRNGYIDDNGKKHSDRPSIPITPGTWYNIVFHIKWSHHKDDFDGFIKIWVNGEKYTSRMVTTHPRT
ncbi:MAG: heparin lyase I family protein [Bacteroidota bacterium]